MKFKKAPQFIGKSLKLYAGGGNKTIGDNDILEGAQWQKFVDHGLLVPVEEKASASAPKVEPKKVEPKPEPKVTPAKKPEPVELPKEEVKESAPEPEKDRGTMTKSTADKMAKAQGKKGKSVSTKKKRK